MLLAKGARDRLEPTLLPLHGLGLTPTPRGQDLLLLDVRRLLGLGRVIYPYDGASLGLELKRVRLEAGDRGIKLGEIHRVCFVCTRAWRVLTRTGHVFLLTQSRWH